MKDEPQYFPCTTCAGVLYEIEVAKKPILCCENCACIDDNLDDMTDTQPQSETSREIHFLAAVSVAARNLMNGLLSEVDEASLKDLTSQFQAASSVDNRAK